MDSLTQLILGAAVGYAVAGKQMGKKALVWGAFAGTLPDLDFIPTLPFDDEFVYLKYHRGFSHSLLFCLTGPPVLGWLVKKIRPHINRQLISWLFFWGFFTHILLDCFTSWGTQVFWPFSERVAFNAIFIVDPGYTVPLLIGLLGAALFRNAKRQYQWVKWGLIISSAYLVCSLVIKGVVHQKFVGLFNTHHVQYERITTRPSPFNLILWSATAETKEGYYYGMVSLLDKTYQARLYFTPKRHHLADSFTDKKTRELISYTNGFYSVEQLPLVQQSEGSSLEKGNPTEKGSAFEKPAHLRNDKGQGENLSKTSRLALDEWQSQGENQTESPRHGIIIHDLRYGFMGDPWIHGDVFVFSYELKRPEVTLPDSNTLQKERKENLPVELTIKNPRPSNTNELLAQLWTRLKGI